MSKCSSSTAPPASSVSDVAVELQSALAGRHVGTAAQGAAAACLVKAAVAAPGLAGGAAEDIVAARAGRHELPAVVGENLVAIGGDDDEFAVGEIEQRAGGRDAVAGNEHVAAGDGAVAVADDGATELRGATWCRAHLFKEGAVHGQGTGLVWRGGSGQGGEGEQGGGRKAQGGEGHGHCTQELIVV